MIHLQRFCSFCTLGFIFNPISLCLGGLRFGRSFNYTRNCKFSFVSIFLHRSVSLLNNFTQNWVPPTNFLVQYLNRQTTNGNLQPFVIFSSACSHAHSLTQLHTCSQSQSHSPIHTCTQTHTSHTCSHTHTNAQNTAFSRFSKLQIFFVLSTEHVSQESLIAVIVGCVLTVLLLILIIIYAVKAGKCCCCNGSGSNPHPSKKDFKNTDIER